MGHWGPLNSCSYHRLGTLEVVVSPEALGPLWSSCLDHMEVFPLGWTSLSHALPSGSVPTDGI